jgi:undecaprenyl diphosphate synthase
VSTPAPVPRHVAVIMDGNGRWAEARGLPRSAGHEAGAESVREIVRAAGQLGIEVLTLYSFSTENWKRPEDEVAALMALLGRYLVAERDELMANRVRLGAIGQVERLDASVRALLEAAIDATAGNDGLHLVLALSYGGRAEIAGAARRLVEDALAGRIDASGVDEGAVAARLQTAGIPDPDLLIRTSGEVRISNFLLWQLAYTEIAVTEVAWPDFRRVHLEAALDEYRRRQRRFGARAADVRSC